MPNNLESIDFDLIIVGGGPGGYVAAERAGALGKRVLLVEKDALGGVCLNCGCIPTKTLLHASKLYTHARDGERFGVRAAGVEFDLGAAMRWKQKVIDTLRSGVAAKMKKHHVTVVAGDGTLLDRTTVRVRDAASNESDYRAKNIIIATGSSSAIPPIPGIRNDRVVTSTELLEIPSLPDRLVIIGGGYIGMEFASFFSAVGTTVTVVEMMDEIVPILDADVASLLRKSIRAVSYELGAKVESLDGGTVRFSRGGATGSATGDLVLVSVGRRANVSGLGLEELGIETTRAGIVVNEYQETNVPGVYAIGDVTGRSLLAHAASRMGEVAVDRMFGPRDGRRTRERMDYTTIPWVVFTSPEVAGCGLTERDAAAAGVHVRVETLTMKSSGRYLAEHPEERGICKIVARADDDRIVGVEMLGSGTSELIFGAALMIHNQMRIGDARRVIFPHPTASEVLRETAWSFEE